ncbi:MAG: hypothetical protein FJY97_05400 [candidate division Zixibacteria bacterium]|nr:hypothetical protein [candidate division Zixibacteria bacterium]
MQYTLFLLPLLPCVLPVFAQNLPTPASDTWQFTGYGRFEVRGSYGRIPTQPVPQEPDYLWWTLGRVGFWNYRIEGGVETVFRERITTRIALTLRSADNDRDFAVLGNDVKVMARLKEAVIQLDQVGFEHLALAGGRQPVVYPLFTDYDYTGGQLIWTIRPGLVFDWGQWQVFEGHIVDGPGKSSDDIDLYGPRISFRYPWVQGQVYGLIHAKAGGNDGVGHNVRIVGLTSTFLHRKRSAAELSAVVQHGNTSTPPEGRRKVRAYALHSRLRHRVANRLEITAAGWIGSEDRVGTPDINETFQSFGYRNTLEKFTFFYRPGLAGLRLLTVSAQTDFARGSVRVDMARIRNGSSSAPGGEEAGLTLEYRYSAHTRIRWRLAATFDGHTMQVYEMSAGF